MIVWRRERRDRKLMPLSIGRIGSESTQAPSLSIGDRRHHEQGDHSDVGESQEDRVLAKCRGDGAGRAQVYSTADSRFRRRAVSQFEI
jgi:hypothetical protein